jgi:hypothetical protein
MPSLPPPTTLTGGFANRYTVTLDGVLQQYSLAADGSTVTGGPDNVNDILVNPVRVQFMDGYMAYSTADTAADVYRLYEGALGRAPTQVELAAKTVSADAAASFLQPLADSLVASTQFQAAYGSLNDTDFVTQLYNDVLHRAPDAGGLNYWVAEMGVGVYSRAQVLEGFALSAEDQANFATTVHQGLWVENQAAGEVARMYETVLGRLPDTTGLAYYTYQFETSGLGVQFIASDMLLSTEFTAVNGAAWNALSNTAFIDLLYSNALHRAPDASSLSFWQAELASGAQRSYMAAYISDSPEHMADAAPHIDNGIWVVG